MPASACGVHVGAAACPSRRGGATRAGRPGPTHPRRSPAYLGHAGDVRTLTLRDGHLADRRCRDEAVAPSSRCAGRDGLACELREPFRSVWAPGRARRSRVPLRGGTAIRRPRRLDFQQLQSPTIVCSEATSRGCHTIDATEQLRIRTLAVDVAPTPHVGRGRHVVGSHIALFCRVSCAGKQ